MNTHCQSNPAAAGYLCTFRTILSQMIHGMTRVQLCDSISYNFIIQMIPHHMAAIEMSRNILRYTHSTPLQSIASGIITEQTKSIENMNRICRTCLNRKNTARDLRCYQDRINRIMQTMFARMSSAPSTSRLNCDFMWEMIPHHMGAVEMSSLALEYAICPELKPILQAIIASQQKGILEMQRLLQSMNCQTPCF